MFARFYVTVCLVIFSLICGCDSIRFAPSEAQKQNAYLHQRTASKASETAIREDVSDELISLTSLSALQSEAFVFDYGFPGELPHAETVDDILNKSSYDLARTASDVSRTRVDAWDIADGAMDIGIAVAGLLGGVWGVRVVSVLRTAKLRSNALREIVLGNELFKKSNSDMADAFKSAHTMQSKPTRKVVAEMKS